MVPIAVYVRYYAAQFAALFTKNVRKSIYLLAIASFPVLVHYGLVDAKAAPVWLPFLLALLHLREDDVEYAADEDDEDYDYDPDVEEDVIDL